MTLQQVQYDLALGAIEVCGQFTTYQWILIEFSIHLCLYTKDGMTAAMIADQHGHLEIVNLLIEAGADVNLGAKVCMNMYLIHGQ